MSVRKLAPGIYDREGGFHIYGPEVLDHLGWPDTEANRARLTEMITELLQEKAPDATITILTGEDQPGERKETNEST